MLALSTLSSGACSGVLFPVLFLDSQIFLTDALFTFMIVTSLASLARIQEGKEIPLPSILAGVFWALAWLTRSQAVLMLPATIVFLS